MQSLCILGRQPELGLAELESLYGARRLRPIGSYAVVVDVDPCAIAFPRLGGSIKLCKFLTTLDTTKWEEVEAYVLDVIAGHVAQVPEGKFKLGISAHGFKVSPKRINATALSFKKAIKATGRNVRIIPNVAAQLSSAQVLHNQLTGPTGWELLFIADGQQTILAQTMLIQDIDAYRQRDQLRPKRDARVGMLPPKLAQILLNIANGELPTPPEPDKNGVCADPQTGAQDKTVLDPFCGTGVILQEAVLMGYAAYGTDIEPRMVDYSQQNLEWFTRKYPGTFWVEIGDALNTSWHQPFNLVAAETYLGRPLATLPNPSNLDQIIRDCDYIHKKFLINLASQTKPGFRMALGVPAWKTPHGFKHLPVLDHLTDMGYTRVSFVHSGQKPLVYYRPGQIVGRELITLVRK